MKLNLFLLIIILSSCGAKRITNHSQNEILMINSSMVDCMGIAPMKCFQVKTLDKQNKEESTWTNMYTRIEGFDYKPGYIYTLKVKKEYLDNKNLPQDSSSIKYTLISIISKTKDIK